MTNKFYIRSKAKTFYKGDPYTDLMLWFAGQLAVSPEKDSDKLVTQKKYVITIKEVR